jgi:hypothetical protein
MYNNKHNRDMSTTNFVCPIDGIVKSADDKNLTLTGEQVIDFVTKVITAIVDAVLMLGTETVITSKQAFGALKQIYLNKGGELNKKFDFKSDQAAMTAIYETAYTLLTVDDFRSEAARIIDNIMTDEKFAFKFLYGSSREHGQNIAPLRSRIIYEIWTSYKVQVNPKDFSTLLYEQLYSEGTWSSLMTYGYRTTFFYWLGTVASHCIMEYLEKNGYIKISRARTPGNTRLALTDKTPVYCEAVISDMVHISLLRDILFAVYVDRLEPEVIQKRMNLSAKDYELRLCTAEKTLKTALINTIHPYEDALVDINVRKTLVSSDFLTIIGETTSGDNENSPLREVLGVGPEDPDFELTVIDFLYNFSDGLGWSEEDKYVWQCRFIKKMTPESVADDLPGRSRGWVDTRYCRLNTRFQTAIREWWDSVTR